MVFKTTCVFAVLVSCASYAVIANGEADIEGAADDPSHYPDLEHLLSEISMTHGHSLVNNSACAADIQKRCDFHDGYHPNDLDILECFHELRGATEDNVDAHCLQEVWKMKLAYTQSDRFLLAADVVCADEFEAITPCQPVRHGRSGEFLACVIEHKEEISKPTCKQFLTQLEVVVFSDYHLISRFVEACRVEIEKHKCARISKHTWESQGETVKCLEEFTSSLTPECQTQALRVAELQGEDYHLDRALYLACRDDRETLCHDIQAGEGRVYSCLLHNVRNPHISEQCEEEIFRREKMVREDYKVSHRLADACEEDIKRLNCENDSSTGHVRLGQILLCLEQALNEGEQVAGHCRSEMLEHRQALLDDHGLPPEVLSACSAEVQKHCDPQTGHGVHMLDCLMSHAMPSKNHFDPNAKFSDQCLHQIDLLLKEANAAEDWRVNPYLMENCQEVYDRKCDDVTPGDGRGLQCLLDVLGTPDMTAECEESLLHLMYFVSRDFTLDPQLYRGCHADATKFCSAGSHWASSDTSVQPSTEHGLVVLSCLYHLALHPEDDRRVQPHCEDEIRRVMRNRRKNVDLHPEVEDFCLPDLALHCSTNTEVGEEILCLEDNLEKLEHDCKEKVKQLVEDEEEHVELNPYIMEHCKTAAEEFCSEYMVKTAGDEELLDCLIRSKPLMSQKPKCSASITHFQLITMKSMRFDKSFRESCTFDVQKFCKIHDINDAKKDDIINCLSEVMLEEAVEDGDTDRLTQKCHDELLVQLYQQEENIDLNPDLKSACEPDIAAKCHAVTEHGFGKVLECLRENFPELTHACKNAIFHEDMIAAREEQVDYTLTNVCHGMAVRYKCSPDSIFECLENYVDDPDFDDDCKEVIESRMIEHSYDYRLNPELQKACKQDVEKHCSKYLMHDYSKKHPALLEGQVIGCLKEQVARHPESLTGECNDHVSELIQQAAKDFRQNPLLKMACRETIRTQCTNKRPEDMEECLKQAFLNRTDKRKGGRIMEKECRRQVENILLAAKSDIHLDPELYGACMPYLRTHCRDVHRGEGRQLKCLLSILDSDPDGVSLECHEKLVARRAMFDFASKMNAPQSLTDLKDVLTGSPVKSMLVFVMVCFAAVVFVGGLAFGRATRNMRYLKNR